MVGDGVVTVAGPDRTVEPVYADAEDGEHQHLEPVYANAVDGEHELGMAAGSSSPMWLHPEISSRRQAEKLLLQQPVEADMFAYLVRLRAGKIRSYAISSLSHGSCAHQLIEQPTPGGQCTVNGNPVLGGRTLDTAIEVVVEQLCRKHKCIRTVPVPVDGFATYC